MSNVYFLGRLVLGLYFLYSAYSHFAHVDALAGYAASKKVPSPRVAVLGTGVMLALGGATILTGLGMTIGLALLIIFLIAVSFMMHAYWKIAEPMGARMAEQINFTKNIALASALLIILSLIA